MLVVVKAQDVSQQLVVDDVVVAVVGGPVDGLQVGIWDQELFVPAHVEEPLVQVVSVSVGSVDDGL